MNQMQLAGPVTGSERINEIDLLRGIALLGILVINIDYFAYPDSVFFNPKLYGGFEGIDRIVWQCKMWFFSQKMMSIFSMLFGAGLVLMMNRAEAKEARFRPFYFRRTFWLLVIGLIHAYLFWSGDILVAYALCGVLIYLFRNKKPRTLIIWASVFFLVGMLLQLGGGASLNYLRNTAEEAERIEQEGGELSPMQSEMKKAWLETSGFYYPSPGELEESIEIYRGGNYGELFSARADSSLMMQTQAFFFMIFWMVTGLMLLGMALLKAKVITGGRTTRFYVILAGVGLLIGFPISFYASQIFLDSNFDFVAAIQISWPLYTVGNTLMALGYIGLIMLFARSGLAKKLQEGLSAVGRTALSNYLFQTLIFTTIFYSYGLGLFAEFNRGTLMLFVVGMWILQLIISPLWLKKFRFGPAEWLWRSLTYKTKQPFRI